ncbi:MAG TPA: acylneuraminate cytidylyltransferase family protein [Candidatus Paceibacterota bacterium]|nr:acylneuraminate cytidylyltransferase family protein [Candidatus Paceibacterota bacterium]
MNIIAFIPARGGSKSIPLKNIKRFYGKPLIAWSIKAACKSKHIDRIIVSTDSEKIAKVARKYGAETPFLRPAKLAGDKISAEPVIKHAIRWLNDNEGYKTDAIVLLMPPNPFRQTFHIDQAIEIFKKKKVDSVVSVNETPPNHTPFWTLVRSKSSKVTLYGGKSIKNILPQRQAFPYKCYGRNDIVYVFKPKNLYQKKPNLYGDKVELIETDPIYEVDINTSEDWLDAEIKFKRILKKSKS